MTGAATNDMKQHITDLVNKALTKADKVVVSDVIQREDAEGISDKVGEINTFLEREFARNEKVVLCKNFKLNDRRFRKRDKLHLNEDGVPVLASNLKYAIARASGVRVKERVDRYVERRDDRRHDDWWQNNGRRHERRRSREW